MTHGKTYNKQPRRINHKATKSKTNTGTTAPERSLEQTTGGGGGGSLKHPYSQPTPPRAPMPPPTQKHKNPVCTKAPNLVNAPKQKHKNQINHHNKQRRVLMANSTVCQIKWKPTTASQAKDISSSPNPPAKVLQRGRHRVRGPNRRRATKEWSTATNNDRADN